MIYIWLMGMMILMVKLNEVGVLIIVLIIITDTVVIIHVLHLRYNHVSDTFVVLIMVFYVDPSDMIVVIVDHTRH